MEKANHFIQAVNTRGINILEITAADISDKSSKVIE